jgi:hypothetical protein
MPDPEKMTRTDVTCEIGGVAHQLKYLNSYDEAAVIREFRRQEKSKLIENLKTCGFDAAQMLGELERFDANPPEKFESWASEIEGLMFCMKLSLLKTRSAAEADPILKEVADWPRIKILEVVGELLGRGIETRSSNAPAGTAAATNTTAYGEEGGADPKAVDTTTYDDPANPIKAA